MSDAIVSDAIVIGAGVIGASVAWHLASRGFDVTVLESRAGPGEGSTGRATGGFRAQYGTRINIALSLLAREKLRRFRDEVGGDCGYRPCGYLWLAQDEAQLASLRAAQRLQHEAGLAEARLVSAAEAAALNPAVHLDGVVGGAFCPTDGFIRPLEILHGYLEGAQRLGAKVVYGARITAVRADAVETSAGTFTAGAVVNAAGAWAAKIARLEGAVLPVVPLRRQVAPTVPCALLPDDMPMTLFAGDGFHLRVRDGRVLLLLPVDEPSGFDTQVDAAWLDRLDALKRARVPRLADVPLDRERAWAGLYEMTPDQHALLGHTASGTWVAAGASGHGVMHAPALGHLLAELIDGAAPALDVRALRPSRFDEGDPNPAPDVL